MILFRWEIKRVQKPNLAKKAFHLTVEDWIKSGLRSPKVEFSLPYSPSKKEVIACIVQCYVKDTFVIGKTVYGENESNAFEKAIVAIEQIIGQKWRPNLVSVLSALEKK